MIEANVLMDIVIAYQDMEEITVIWTVFYLEPNKYSIYIFEIL